MDIISNCLWFEVLTTASVRTAVLWFVAPLDWQQFTSFSETGQWNSCPNDRRSAELLNVRKFTPVYTALKQRRQPSSPVVLFSAKKKGPIINGAHMELH
jgi:hypothetical protein